MNNFKIVIDGVDYTKYAIFPLKIANFLDEQLDEAYISLKRVPIEYFKPLTKVTIELVNCPEAIVGDSNEIVGRAETDTIVSRTNDEYKRIQETLTINMIVANDKSIETPAGSGKFTHEIYLIELTKILEGYIGDSITFTNVLAGYNENKTVKTKTPFYWNDEFINLDFSSPQEQGNLVIPGIKDIFSSIKTEKGLVAAELHPQKVQGVEITSLTTGELFFRMTHSGPSDNPVYVEEKDKSYTLDVNDNYYIPKQNLVFYMPEGAYAIRYVIPFNDGSRLVEGEFSVLPFGLTPAKWTITSVVNRIFETVEPLLLEQKPKFRLKGVNYNNKGKIVGYDNGSTAEKLNKILSPEFAFTKMTLREMLKQVGGFIHAEPRIVSVNTENGKTWYEIDFENYVTNKMSWIKSGRRYVSATFGTNINDYCTGIDSSVDNLINQLDWAQGVITEPFIGGGVSLRTESVAVRLSEDDDSVIKTMYPIYSLGLNKQVFCTHIPGVDDSGGPWDITPYIFEKADYEILSSYSNAYPNSKMFALYYEQGQKNIKGLFFKKENPIHESLEKYTIVNILEKVVGKKLDGLSGINEYAKIEFNVTYLPIYSTRIKTHKQCVISGASRTLSYNQGANYIETQYYGEHLKGVVARLGNVEKTYTYHLAYLSDMPKIGMRYDENYFISAVSIEYLPTYIKCTLSLSKDFNRLSQYVGISSNKRMWEVSEKQSYERESVLTDYLLISKEKHEDSSLFNINDCGVAQLLFDKEVKPVSSVQTNRRNEVGDNIGLAISFPVISSSMGNSMFFSFKFADNYSAGVKNCDFSEVFKTNEDKFFAGGYYAKEKMKGIWSVNLPYCDYYGRFYSLGLIFKFGYLEYPSSTNASKFPQGYINGNNGSFQTRTYIKYRKDSREIPSITYEIAAVTDNKNLIIGSALMSNCCAVTRNKKDLELYVFYHLLDSVDSKLDLTSATKIDAEIEIGSNYIQLPSSRFGMAWALITKPDSTYITGIDETGQKIKQEIKTGGELVLGANEPLRGQKYYFSMQQNIYD